MKLLAPVAVTLAFTSLASVAQAVTPVSLKCEQRQNPLGVDVMAPRLSWNLSPGSRRERGLRQSAYEVLVASSPSLLARNQGDLWSVGRVPASQSLALRYAGKPLRSAQQVFWKVRVWDQNGRRSAWSAPARWTMGLLRPSDWGASWIGATDTPVRSLRGYHGSVTTGEYDVKWVQVDLGRELPIESVRLHPMFHDNRAGFGFPVRFKVEASSTPGFENPIVIADRTSTDFPNPGTKPVSFDGKETRARFVRLTGTRLWKRDASIYSFALSQMQVLAGGRNAAKGARVTASDSHERDGWGAAALSDGALNPDDGVQLYETLMLRREFVVRPGLRRAVAFVSGLGHYEMTLNGQKAGDDLLAPGWTDYRKTCLYDTRDITSLLRAGPNAVGLMLGNGMYNVKGGRYSKFTGSLGPLKAIALIRLEYNDGSVQNVGTDGSWRLSAGPITFSEVYGGEDYDARLEQQNWDRPAFDDSRWKPVLALKGPGGALRGVSVSAPPIRTFEKLKPVATRRISPNVTVYDLGQNTALMPRLVVRGAAGSIVRIIPSELLAPDGHVDQAGSGGPSYWQYTLAGRGSGRASETYFPKFFYRGARYLQVETSAPTGSALPQVEIIDGYVIHADSPVAGSFACSNELFNRIYRLVLWAQRSNMVSVLTDCPHREKLGWLEQDYLNGPSLRYNFDMAPMFSKVMNDMADAQLENGLVPDIAPEYVIFGGGFRDSPEWGSAFLQVAWQQFLFSGDLEPLRLHYEQMERYVAYLGSTAKGHIVDHGLGDWCDIGPRGPGEAQLTPKALTATAIYFEDAQVPAQAARLLGKPQDVQKYEALARDIKHAFNAKFWNPDTRTYATGSQTANAMPVVAGLVEPQHQAAVVEAIVRDVRAHGNALTAGDVGYRYLLRALADKGRSDVVFAINNQTEKPGYGYQLKQGATSLIETWDANRGVSQNHFMMGQIIEWFYHDLAGIQPVPSSAGFAKFVIKPAVVGDLKWVSAHFDSAHGRIASTWKREGQRLTMEVTVPSNTAATVCVPAADAAQVSESGTSATRARGVKYLRMEDGRALYAVSSGVYTFTSSVR